MPRRGTLLALLLALAPLAGCLAPTDGAPSGEIPFETVDRGANSEIEEREEIVVRTSEAWAELWQRHAPDDQRPEIDFDERMVLAIFKGESPNGCHGALVENVTGEEGSITAHGAYVEVTGAHCTQQITHPYHIVVLQRYDAEVTFDVREETRQLDDGQDADDGTDGADGSGEQPDEDGSGDPSDEDPDTGEGTYTCRDPGEEGDSLTGAESAGFQTIEDGSSSGIEEACVTVARNETAWRDLWAAHGGQDGGRPTVDFETHLVAAVFKGESPNACHGAEIEEVTREGEDLVVHGAFYETEGQACAEVLTYPFHIVETQRPEGEVRFDVREETRQA